MAKYQVTGKIVFLFDVDVEASSPEDAERRVKEMGPNVLVEEAPMPKIEIDYVDRVRGR